MKKVSGTADERITIKGAGGRSSRESVVLRGAGGSSRVFQLMHDYYTLEVRLVWIPKLSVQQIKKYRRIKTHNFQNAVCSTIKMAVGCMLLRM